MYQCTKLLTVVHPERLHPERQAMARAAARQARTGAPSYRLHGVHASSETTRA